MSQGETDLPGVDVLLVCTGNQCRSPMAAAIMTRLLSERGSAFNVASGGFVSEGIPCPPEVLKVMGPLGYDLSAHRSRALSEALLDSARIVVGMTRQHVVDLSLVDPTTWSRTFTFSELVRLGKASPARRSSESLDSWVARIGAGRHRARILDLPLSEDVPDPIGKPLGVYIRTRDRLVALATGFADLIEPV